MSQRRNPVAVPPALTDGRESDPTRSRLGTSDRLEDQAEDSANPVSSSSHGIGEDAPRQGGER